MNSSIALLTVAMPRPAALYNRRKWQLIGKSQWCCSANCGHLLHALTYNWTRGMQLANTPPLQSTTPGLHPVSFHQMAPLVRGNTRPITAYYSVYRCVQCNRLNERLNTIRYDMIRYDTIHLRALKKADERASLIGTKN